MIAARILKREFRSYFESPIAYVFLVVFLMLTMFLTFFVTRFYEIEQANLRPFFDWHPWVYLLLVPAASMRLWAEERRSGTIEILLTLPISMWEAIVGKFLAAWMFLALALGLTFPIVITTAYLGDPDAGAIVGGYIGSLMLGGTCLSVGVLTSAMTRNQVISFVLSLMLCLVLLMAGWPPFTLLFVRWATNWLVEGVAAFSFMPHYEVMRRGVLDLRGFGYFISVMIVMLYTSYLVLENRRGQ